MKKKQYSEQKKNWFLYVGGAITIVMAALIVLGYFWTPYDPGAMDAACKAAPPSLAHIMGTDNFGRDIFSRVLQGAGMTFFIAVCVVAVGAVCGTVIGGLTGYFGGWGDEALMRVCDAITAFPRTRDLVVVIAVLGPGKWNVIWVLGILFIPSFARIVRVNSSSARTSTISARPGSWARAMCASWCATSCPTPCPCCCPPFPSASTTPSWRRPA